MVDWDPVATEVVRKCCETGVKIVVTSTWRIGVELSNDESALVSSLIKHRLYDHLFLPDWKTPYLGTKRGLEIADWLRSHPEVVDYRILDDDSDMLEEQTSRFIQTHCHDGISGKQMIELLDWAEGKKL